MVSKLSAIRDVLDRASLERIRQADQPNSSFTLSYRSAKALTGLKGKVADLPKALQGALDEIFARHLSTRHIEALVDHIASGNPAQDFNHTQVKYKPRKNKAGAQEGDSGDKTSRKAGKKKKKGKGIKKALKKLQKVGAKGLFSTLKFIAGVIHKYVREGAKTTAGYFCPLHSRSSRKNGGSSSTPHPIRFLGHWGLYWFCVLFGYGSIVGILGFIGHFIPIVGPLIDTACAFLYHLAIRLILWVLAHALANPWVVLALGLALVGWIHEKFQTRFFETAFIAALLIAAWWFKGLWVPKLGLELPANPPQVVMEATPSVQVKSRVGSTSNPKPRVLNPANPTPTFEVPPQYQPRERADEPRVKLFVSDLFGTSYHDIQGWLGNLRDEVTPGYWDQFLYENYPPAKIQQIQDQKWNCFFKLTRPIQCVNADEVLDDFRVEGVVTTKGDSHYQGEVVSIVPVTVIVEVRQGAKGPEVCKVERAPTP